MKGEGQGHGRQGREMYNTQVVETLKVGGGGSEVETAGGQRGEGVRGDGQRRVDGSRKKKRRAVHPGRQHARSWTAIHCIVIGVPSND